MGLIDRFKHFMMAQIRWEMGPLQAWYIPIIKHGCFETLLDTWLTFTDRWSWITLPDGKENLSLIRSKHLMVYAYMCWFEVRYPQKPLVSHHFFMNIAILWYTPFSIQMFLHFHGWTLPPCLAIGRGLRFSALPSLGFTGSTLKETRKWGQRFYPWVSAGSKYVCILPFSANMFSRCSPIANASRRRILKHLVATRSSVGDKPWALFRWAA